MGSKNIKISDLHDDNLHIIQSDLNQNNTEPKEENNLSEADSLFEVRAIWTALGPRLRSILGPLDFKAWIEPLKIVSADNNVIIMNAANGFARSRIRTQYLHRLQRIWDDFDPSGRRIVVECQNKSDNQQNPQHFITKLSAGYSISCNSTRIIIGGSGNNARANYTQNHQPFQFL